MMGTRNAIRLVSLASARYPTVRHYATEGKQPGFISKVIDNLKSEFSKNKEMKDSISKFREEAKKLEESEALKQARRKFEKVESEASKSSEVLKEGIGTVKAKLDEAITEASKHEFVKKAGEVGTTLGKQAQNVVGSVTEGTQKIAGTATYKAVSGAATAIKEEITEGTLDNIYRPPLRLRKRSEISEEFQKENIQPNEDATGVELHKDSKFYQSWENFKNNNPYVNKMLDWKIQYDESENPMVRASRALTNKLSDVVGGLFQRTEVSDALTEILKIDPSFDKDKFLIECEKDIIPNILEAMCRGELEVLEDWCYEAAFAVLSQPFKAAKERGLKIRSKIIDISHVDLAMGRVLEQGPVLVITFTSQQITFVHDPKGNIVEGDPEKVMRVNHAWVLCRDVTELNPKAAWRLLELSASATEQLL